MAVKKIVTVPNSILTNKTGKVTKFNSEIENIIKDLQDTLDSAKEPEGSGIAATQIGISKRICVVRNYFRDPNKPQTQLHEDILLINPKIARNSQETNIDWEGCLSVPNIYGKVRRFNEIKVAFQNIKGEKQKLKAKGYLATVVQHEIDHLNGILFTDRVLGETKTGDEFEEKVKEI